MIRGQDPKTKELSLKGEVLELVHRKILVNVVLEDGRSCLFPRGAVRKDFTKKYQEAEEEKLRNQVARTCLKTKDDGQLEESM